MKEFFGYIMANWPRGTLYVGVTSSIGERVRQHRSKEVAGFTSRYRLDRLVFCERAPDARSAIMRERQLKEWKRAKKIALIESANANWRDLAEDWFTE